MNELFKALDLTENGSLVDEAVYATGALTILTALIVAAFKAPIRGGGTGSMLGNALRDQGVRGGGLA